MQSIISPVSFDSKTVNTIIQQLCDKYKSLKSYSVGLSVSGSEIKCLKIGNARNNVLFVGAVHGNENITCGVILKFVEEMCFCYENGIKFDNIDLNAVFKNRSFLFVPMANPDGCDIVTNGADYFKDRSEFINARCNKNVTEWKANLHGVDINHNFNAGWKKLSLIEKMNGIFGPSSGKFGGECPDSEPETNALESLCRLMQPAHLVALHTQGEVIYYGYGNICKDKCIRMAEIMAATSGYTLDEPDELSAGGGLKDWFIEKFKKPAFTLEIGKGKNPLPPHTLNLLYLRIRETLSVAAIM